MSSSDEALLALDKQMKGMQTKIDRQLPVYNSQGTVINLPSRSAL
jgi:hypothetical protein